TLVGFEAVKVFHEAGVPADVLQFVPGDGATVGAALTADPRVDGVAFTGSTFTARAINRALAARDAAIGILVAETGGQNALIADSSALPEQLVRDVLASAFTSAGQRCSAARILFVQEDIADKVITMLAGAMAELQVGDPGLLSTDVGPVIDDEALKMLDEHAARMDKEAKLIAQAPARDGLEHGSYFLPKAWELKSLDQLDHEKFGPALHVIRWKSSQLDQVIDAITATGYGLTLGIHSRIDETVDHIVARARVGNVYVNRNLIGAVVGVQPFGGRGLSGTGPKAGGPHYLPRFFKSVSPMTPVVRGEDLDLATVQTTLDNLPDTSNLPQNHDIMPGPTGESNELFTYARGKILCLGPSVEEAVRQAETARENGCKPLICVPGAKGEHTLDGFLPREH